MGERGSWWLIDKNGFKWRAATGAPIRRPPDGIRAWGGDVAVGMPSVRPGKAAGKPKGNHRKGRVSSAAQAKHQIRSKCSEFDKSQVRGLLGI